MKNKTRRTTLEILEERLKTSKEKGYSLQFINDLKKRIKELKAKKG